MGDELFSAGTQSYGRNRGKRGDHLPVPHFSVPWKVEEFWSIFRSM